MSDAPDTIHATRAAVGDTPALDARLRFEPAPHWHGAGTTKAIVWWWIAAAALPLVVSLAVSGGAALRVAAVAIATALVSESVLAVALLGRHCPAAGFHRNALLTGLLTTLVMPPAAPTYTVVVVALLASAVGHVLPGGLGNYLWHPVALGRVLAETLAGPILPGSVGSPHTPVQYLTAMALGGDAFSQAGESPITVLIRDYLPSWEQTLVGAGTPLPPIGECPIALVAAALLLAWRGHVRKRCILAGLATAALTAFVLPIRQGGGLVWFPGLVIDDSLPVGLAYVLYQLTCGEVLLVVLLLAGDPVTTPLTARGQQWFGAGLGVLAMALRLYGLAGLAGYWALLAMNTLVPTLDRWTRRRVYGT